MSQSVMKYFIVIYAVMLIGCSSRPDSSTTDSSGQSARDSSELAPEADSLGFVGFIDAIEGTDELYTDLFFRKDSFQNMYDFLARSSDSLVYQDDQIKRSALPFPVAQEYFDLRGLNSVELFDARNQLLGTARLQRIEFYEEVVEAGFVAVFKMDKQSSKEPQYCLSKGMGLSIIKDVRYAIRILKRADGEIQKQIVTTHPGVLREIEFMPANKRYLVISGDTSEHIFESETGNILYQSKQSETIIRVIPVPIEVNGRPLLLVSFSEPETDIFWERLLRFNGERYEFSPRNRF
jgi:hypothetical protein